MPGSHPFRSRRRHLLAVAAMYAAAPAEGHKLLLTGINIVSMNPALIEKMPFDPQRAFAPVSLLGTTSLALAVHPRVPVTSVQELVELARRQPGKIS